MELDAGAHGLLIYTHAFACPIWRSAEFIPYQLWCKPRYGPRRAVYVLQHRPFMSNPKLTEILANPAAVPPSLRQQAETVSRMFEQLAEKSVSKIRPKPGAAALFASMAAGDCESTISILGDRGHGKTTLLLFVCADLIARNFDFVLPIARPDRFAPSDTLMGWVLAAIRESLEQECPAVLDKERDWGSFKGSLRERLEQLRHQEALISRGFGEGLPHQSLSSGEFARDASDLRLCT